MFIPTASKIQPAPASPKQHHPRNSGKNPGISPHVYQAELIWHPGRKTVFIALGLWGNLSGDHDPNLQLNIFDVTASPQLDLTYEQFLKEFFAFPDTSDSIHDRPRGLRPMAVLSPHSELYEHHPKYKSRGCSCEIDDQLRSFPDGRDGLGFLLTSTELHPYPEYFRYNFVEQNWTELRGGDPQAEEWRDHDTPSIITYAGVDYLPWKEFRRQAEERIAREKEKTAEILKSIKKETEARGSLKEGASWAIYLALLDDAEKAARQNTDLELVIDNSVWTAIKQFLESAPEDQRENLKNCDRFRHPRGHQEGKGTSKGAVSMPGALVEGDDFRWPGGWVACLRNDAGCHAHVVPAA